MVPELSWSCRSKARRADAITSSGSVSLYTDIPSRARRWTSPRGWPAALIYAVSSNFYTSVGPTAAICGTFLG